MPDRVHPTYRSLPDGLDTSQLRLCSECGAIVAFHLRFDHDAMHGRLDALSVQVSSWIAVEAAAHATAVREGNVTAIHKETG